MASPGDATVAETVEMNGAAGGGANEAEEALDVLALAETAMETLGVVGTVVFARIAGSRGYNTVVSEKGADVDLYIVYAASTEDVLLSSVGGSTAVADVVHNTKGTTPDVAAYEVRKFLELLIQGNAHAVEAVFTSHLCAMAPQTAALWERLRKEFSLLLINPGTLRGYLGHALSELYQIRGLMANDVPIHKALYHAMRLVMEAQRIADGQPPAVWMTGEQRRRLLRIRRRIRDEESTVESEHAAAQEWYTRLKEWAPMHETLEERNARTEPLFALADAWLYDVRVSLCEEVQIPVS